MSAEGQKIVVSADEVIGMAGAGEGEKGVVRGVADRGRDRGHVGQDDGARRQ